MLRPISQALKSLCTNLLGVLARAIIHKYEPTVVMVTGSVGKTSTKDAVAAALSENFYVRKSDKSFNSDLGVPLTILGAANPWSHPLAWLGVFKKGLGVLLLPTHYPALLVLEVGADHPGDLDKILKIVRPDAVVVTLLPSVPVHVEMYENPAAVREEEFAPALALAPGAPLIISVEDEFAVAYAAETDADVQTFGAGPEASVRISEVAAWMEGGIPKGMQATLSVLDASGPTKHELQVPGALGSAQLFAPAAALATALALGMTTADALKGLSSYVPPPGRGRLFVGKKDTVLIDDSYNSSPVALEEILRSLAFLPVKGKRIAILGDMLELGRYSLAEHTRVGRIARECVDILVTIGPRARVMGDAAHQDGMREERIHHFGTSIEAVAPVEELIGEGDVVLIKGSQGVRMERIVRPLLEDFADVEQLVRQEEEWQKR